MGPIGDRLRMFDEFGEVVGLLTEVLRTRGGGRP
jgi:hypothetical protein